LGGCSAKGIGDEDDLIQVVNCADKQQGWEARLSNGGLEIWDMVMTRDLPTVPSSMINRRKLFLAVQRLTV
jgi:hypothetical protein